MEWRRYVNVTTVFLGISVYKRSFYQDRLGTNIGETQKRVPFSETSDPPRSSGDTNFAGIINEDGMRNGVFVPTFFRT